MAAIQQSSGMSAMRASITRSQVVAVRRLQRGADRAAAMATLIMTAKLNDVDPQAWLVDVANPRRARSAALFREADPAIFDEAGKPVPTLEHVVGVFCQRFTARRRCGLSARQRAAARTPRGPAGI